jgi:uncharacterized FAD-dependent dehydrogenase
MVGIDIRLPLSFEGELLRKAVSDKLGEPYGGEIKLLRRELDLSGAAAAYKIRAGVCLDPYLEARLCKKGLARPCPALELSFPKKSLSQRPIVVGSGPCGLFAALTLAEAGACPIVIERGLPVDERKAKVSEFERGGDLDPECNVQFGEGGAGTFSDGKLKHGAMDAYKHKVLSEFVFHGADEDILFDAEPHVGTDVLSEIIKKIRKKIIALGGEFMFGTKLCGLIIKNGAICGIRILRGNEEGELYTDRVVLAIGHSARDTFKMLNAEKILCAPRGFGIGVRIEHKRSHIDKMIYGEKASEIERAASYHFVTHLGSGRSVYSFCMCPGGSVVAATGERGAVVTNGMSLHARDGENSNAAFLVSVTPDDFSGDPMAGLDLQGELERRAFSISNDYKAPAVRMEDFMASRASAALGDVNPTYPRGVVLAHPDEFLPQFISESIREAIPDFDSYRKGFYCPDAVLTGVETRTTSPLRLLRGEDRVSVSLKGLYPCGEGAGYAGGIVSSAVDGIKTAEAILSE